MLFFKNEEDRRKFEEATEKFKEHAKEFEESCIADMKETIKIYKASVKRHKEYVKEDKEMLKTSNTAEEKSFFNHILKSDKRMVIMQKEALKSQKDRLAEWQKKYQERYEKPDTKPLTTLKLIQGGLI